MRKAFIALFTPYTKVSDRVAFTSGAVQLALLLVFWATATIPVLPDLQQTLNGLLVVLSEKGLIPALGKTMILNIKAFGIATFLALLLACLRTMSVFRAICDFITGFRFIGPFGVLFVVLAVTKDIELTKLCTLIFAILPYLLDGMVDMVRGVTDEELEHARTLKMNNLQTTWHVIIRSRLHTILDVVRQNASIGWVMAVGVEATLREGEGVGVLLAVQSKYMMLSELFAVLLVVYLVGRAQDLFLRGLRNTVCSYAVSTAKGL
jgi:ABC-type nitrate/sulfonate/bicarbonate transport system permease component